MKREKELERVVALQEKEIEAKKSQNIPVRRIPDSHHCLSLKCPQRGDEVEEELTCEICAMRMWLPYRCAPVHLRLVRWSLTTVLG